MSEERPQYIEESPNQRANRLYNHVIEQIEMVEAGKELSQEELEWLTAYMLANIVDSHRGKDPQNITQAFRRVMIHACDIANMSYDNLPTSGTENVQ